MDVMKMSWHSAQCSFACPQYQVRRYQFRKKLFATIGDMILLVTQVEMQLPAAGWGVMNITSAGLQSWSFTDSVSQVAQPITGQVWRHCDLDLLRCAFPADSHHLKMQFSLIDMSLGFLLLFHCSGNQRNTRVQSISSCCSAYTNPYKC